MGERQSIQRQKFEEQQNFESKTFDEMSFTKCIFLAGVSFNNCDIARLTFSKCRILGPIIVNGCSIAQLDLRLTKINQKDTDGANLSLVNSTLHRVMTNNVKVFSMKHTEVDSEICINNACSVDVGAQSSCRTLNIENASIPAPVKIEVVQFGCADAFKVSDIVIEDLKIKGLVCEQLIFDKCKVSRGVIESSRIKDKASLALTRTGENTFEIRSSEIRILQLEGVPVLSGGSEQQGVDADVPGQHEPQFSLQGSTVVTELFRLTDASVRITNAKIDCQVMRESERDLLLLDESGYVSTVDIPDRRYNRLSKIRNLSKEWFGGVTVPALGVLFRSYADRPVEQDLVYYLLKTSEQRPWYERILVFLGSWLTGWGVLLTRPLISMIALISVSALGAHLASPRLSILQDFVMTLSFWFGFGTWAPTFTSSESWSLFALVCGLFGLYFTTIIIGILIRRLVR